MGKSETLWTSIKQSVKQAFPEAVSFHDRVFMEGKFTRSVKKAGRTFREYADISDKTHPWNRAYQWAAKRQAKTGSKSAAQPAPPAPKKPVSVKAMLGGKPKDPTKKSEKKSGSRASAAWAKLKSDSQRSLAVRQKRSQAATAAAQVGRSSTRTPPSRTKLSTSSTVRR
jgi:hypothetical protein